MRRQISLVTILIMASAQLSVEAAKAEHDQLKAFPSAKQGQERFVIVLPHKERGEEDAFKVELFPGKTMMTDSVNKMRIGCKIESRPLKGWGYTYYEVTGSGAAMSTLMAPPPGAKKIEQWVSGAPLMIRYNSRLPVVVYAPKGLEVRYRIWKAPVETKAADSDIKEPESSPDIGNNQDDTKPQSFAVHAIGTVNKVGERTTIVLDKKVQKGLLGLDQLSHIFVLWWFDKNDTPQKRSILQVNPRGNKKNPLTGVFATRAPFRPNLIAQTRCKVISVKNNVIEIDTIDAFPGTPVLDIKPASTPPWMDEDDPQNRDKKGTSQ